MCGNYTMHSKVWKTLENFFKEVAFDGRKFGEVGPTSFRKTSQRWIVSTFVRQLGIAQKSIVQLLWIQLCHFHLPSIFLRYPNMHNFHPLSKFPKFLRHFIQGGIWRRRLLRKMNKSLKWNEIKFECNFSLQKINLQVMHFISFIEKCIFLIIIIHFKKLKDIFHVGFLFYIIFIVMIVAQVYLVFPHLNSFKCGPWLLKVIFILKYNVL